MINTIDNSDMLTDLMVPIPKGTITLRDDRIKTEWTVAIERFLLAKFPVTQTLYMSITGTSPSAFKGNNKPVECVSFIEAIKFCNLLSQSQAMKEYYSFGNDDTEIINNVESDGYRLPFEAEWEYACRAGSSKPIYGSIDNIAWYKENSCNQTHDVGQKEPSQWGLYDMLGNVWEWCGDVYDEKVYGTYRIFRGGGWNDSERGCLASNRRRSHPSFQIDDLGFRIARNLLLF
jgi:formylglycine-generating enzyme required for sulfatase activity